MSSSNRPSKRPASAKAASPRPGEAAAVRRAPSRGAKRSPKAAAPGKGAGRNTTASRRRATKARKAAASSRQPIQKPQRSQSLRQPPKIARRAAGTAGGLGERVDERLAALALEVRNAGRVDAQIDHTVEYYREGQAFDKDAGAFMQESHAHDIEITRESPNYSR